MEVQICPVKKLYQIALEADMQNVAAILVSDDFIDINRLSRIGRLSVHSFADTVDSTGISRQEAVKIAAFVKSLGKETDTLFCCCDAGQSRSPAMAAAICHHLGMDEMAIWKNPHYSPNPAVYQAVCRAFDIPVSDGLLAILLQINRDALRDAMGR